MSLVHAIFKDAKLYFENPKSAVNDWSATDVTVEKMKGNRERKGE